MKIEDWRRERMKFNLVVTHEVKLIPNLCLISGKVLALFQVKERSSC